MLWNHARDRRIVSRVPQEGHPKIERLRRRIVSSNEIAVYPVGSLDNRFGDPGAVRLGGLFRLQRPPVRGLVRARVQVCDGTLDLDPLLCQRGFKLRDARDWLDPDVLDELLAVGFESASAPRGIHGNDSINNR